METFPVPLSPGWVGLYFFFWTWLRRPVRPCASRCVHMHMSPFFYLCVVMEMRPAMDVAFMLVVSSSSGTCEVGMMWVGHPSNQTRVSSPFPPPRWCLVIQQRSKVKGTATVFGREAHANGRTATKRRRTRRPIRCLDVYTSQPSTCGAECEETRDGGCGGWPAKPRNSLRNPPASWKRNTSKASNIHVAICDPTLVLEREMESKTTPKSGSREGKHPSSGSPKLHR